MKDIEWEDYVGVGPASDSDIDAAEAVLGISFPAEFRDLLKAHQGQVPEPQLIDSPALVPVGFGPVLHVQPDPTDEDETYSVLYVHKIWKGIHPNLVPIADNNGSGCCFAYDYSIDKDSPRIVFVNSDAHPQDEPEKAVLFVANNLTELLERLHPREKPYAASK